MNKQAWLLLAAGAFAAASLAVRPALAGSNPQQGDQPLRRTVTVVGSGRASASPDIARVTLGVDVVNARLSVALSEVNKKTADIMAALKKAGVEEKNIRTADFNVIPQQAYGPSGPGPITGYRVINTMRVTLRDLSKAGSVLDAAVGAGANTIQGLTFTIEDIKPVEANARRDAMADAKAKAEALAQEAGASVRRVLTISEIVTGGPIPIPLLATAATVEGMGGGVSISPGTQEVNVQVQATYEIE